MDELLRVVPPDAVAICERLKQRGFKGWIVGGCVRDLLRGEPAKDWDIATDAVPREVMGMFRKVIPTGVKHGTVTVMLGGEPFEVTTLRGEGAYRDGRHPDGVVFLKEIVEDLARRDFTFNAMAIDPLERRLIDPFGGAEDLRAHLLRAVGEPRDRFTEDGLRVLRGARFAATLGCSIEPATLAAMGERKTLDTLRQVSLERVHDEWLKTLAASKPSVGFDIMRETGILAVHCPELMESVGCVQNRYHRHDVWRHVMYCVDSCPPDPVLRLAALLHDVAKPRTKEVSPKTGEATFYNHEIVGAEMAEDILRRLRFSGDHRRRVVHLIRHHLICYSPSWSDSAVRRWLRRVSVERLEDLFHLAEADALAKGCDCSDDLAGLSELRTRVEAVIGQGQALGVRDLDIDGNILMEELGLSPSRLIGDVLGELVESVVDDPAMNERGRLLQRAREIVSSRRGG